MGWGLATRLYFLPLQQMHPYTLIETRWEYDIIRVGLGLARPMS